MNPVMKKRVTVAAIFASACAMLLAVSFIAGNFLAADATLYAAVSVFVPIVIVAIFGVLLGLQIKWNLIKGLCVALALTLISLGISYLPIGMTAEEIAQQQLEKLLEEGAMPEDGVIISEEIVMPEGGESMPIDPSQYGDGDVVVYTQESTTSSEIIGNVLTFLIAFGGCFAGGKIREQSDKNKAVVE
jgi:hypothetical protein